MIAILIIGVVFVLFYPGYYLLMKWASRQSCGIRQEPDYRPEVSVVIATYNEAATILKRLENLMTQDYQGKTETVIVDSASTDRTVELAEEFCQRSSLKVTILKEKERRGKASALNYAFSHCSGDIVVMTDADAAWREDTLRQLVSNFSDRKVGAATGRQVLLNPRQSQATRVEVTYRVFFDILRLGESVLDTTPIFSGETAGYRKSLVSLISEDSMADDSELAVKVRKKGYRAIYDPGAIFYEYAPPTFGSRFAQKVRRGQGLVQLFLREWRLLFNLKYGKFGGIIFPAEFFMHLVSPVLLLALVGLIIYEIVAGDFLVLLGMAAILLLLGLFLVIRKINAVSLAVSFLNSQFILLVALFYQLAGKHQHKWQKIEEIRELWR